MIPRERCAYSAIVDRPPLVLPNRARLVVWTIVNLEFWDISRPMARQVLPAPTGQVLLPDVPNWSWHEYGMRVGVWRFFELFRRLSIRPTLSINARVCEDYERVARAARQFKGRAIDDRGKRRAFARDHADWPCIAAARRAISSGGTSSSRFKPCGVSSKTQLKISAGMKPIASRLTMLRGNHSGAPNIGSTVLAT